MSTAFRGANKKTGPISARIILAPSHFTRLLVSWHGGQLPPGLRAGVVHEMKRRNMRQDEIARRVGLSRPQFTNVLQGRFGIGAQAAEKLKAFVLEEVAA